MKYIDSLFLQSDLFYDVRWHHQIIQYKHYWNVFLMSWKMESLIHGQKCFVFLATKLYKNNAYLSVSHMFECLSNLILFLYP